MEEKSCGKAAGGKSDEKVHHKRKAERAGFMQGFLLFDWVGQ
jgi:hypothetical protein